MLISNFAKRALKIGIILVVSLLAVEFFMTVLDPYLFKDRFENDPDMGFKVRAYYPTGLGLHGRGDDGTLHIADIFKAIDEMNELLKSKGIKFMVAIYPDEFQVSPVQFDTLVQHFGLNKKDYDLDLAQNLLKTFLESKRISYLDMLDRFKTEESRRELYLYKNTHWNEAGNNLAADLLFQYLIAQPYEFNNPH